MVLGAISARPVRGAVRGRHGGCCPCMRPTCCTPVHLGSAGCARRRASAPAVCGAVLGLRAHHAARRPLDVRRRRRLRCATLLFRDLDAGSPLSLAALVVSGRGRHGERLHPPPASAARDATRSAGRVSAGERGVHRRASNELGEFEWAAHGIVVGARVPAGDRGRARHGSRSRAAGADSFRSSGKLDRFPGEHPVDSGMY